MAVSPTKADQTALDLLSNIEIALVKALGSEHPECKKLFGDFYRLAGKVSSRTRVLQRAITAAGPKAEVK